MDPTRLFPLHLRPKAHRPLLVVVGVVVFCAVIYGIKREKGGRTGEIEVRCVIVSETASQRSYVETEWRCVLFAVLSVRRSVLHPREWSIQTGNWEERFEEKCQRHNIDILHVVLKRCCNVI